MSKITLLSRVGTLLALGPLALCAALPACAPARSESRAAPGVAMVSRPSAHEPGAAVLQDPAAHAPQHSLGPSIHAQRISGETPHLPALVRDSYRAGTVSGTYRICIGHDGRVSSVAPVAGIVSADKGIMFALKSWKYQPQAVRFCLNEELNFVLQ